MLLSHLYFCTPKNNTMALSISAIVLTAGASSRMGKPKAFLEWNGSTFIETICFNLSKLNLLQIVLVSSISIDIKRQLKPTKNIDWTKNPHPEDGMLSSFRCGLRKLKSKNTNVMLCLIDHPAVEQETYKKLCDNAKKDKIVIPIYKGRRGHPVIFGADFICELLEKECPEGAKTIVKSHPESVLEIEVDDKGILMDIDTPKEYETATRNSPGKS